MSWGGNWVELLCRSREEERNLWKIPTEIPTPTFEYLKRKGLTLLTDIGGDWFINNMRNHKPPMKKPSFSKKQQQQQDKLKGWSKIVCDRWKDWKFQIHWKMWFVVPRKHDTKKNAFCMSYNMFFLTDGLQYNNWVRQ